ncbi:putative lipopolysaccharide biosynthesis protein [alpha proteobacterium BAL199]|nr:enoyl-CoA hydratase [alpha proteobacterium BAL199]EDP63883.1 putative lipopolysaccharide biosynthesis protein [alpha proteobacterium BAL199]
MAVLLAGIGPGDEVIMPSFTFVSAATAVVLRGGVPVFVDINPVSLNLDPAAVEGAITDATKAIITVHYASVGTGIDRLVTLCQRHGLILIEDAAHAVGATFEGQPLGSFGQMATLSFHETKNVISGEGGALLINDPELIARAEVISDKGTDRARFERGETQKYVWQDVGSSFRASELTSAFLLAQLEEQDAIVARRRELWARYHIALESHEIRGGLLRPNISQSCGTNGHIYYVLLSDEDKRRTLIDGLKAQGIHAVFHYVPLHDSPAGRRYSRTAGSMAHTVSIASRILRLPMHLGLTNVAVDRVVTALGETLGKPSDG